MVHDSNATQGLKTVQVSSILLSTTVFLSLQPAYAVDGRLTMKEFRGQNNNLSGKEARQLYRDTFGRRVHSVDGIKLPPNLVRSSGPSGSMGSTPVSVQNLSRPDRSYSNQTLHTVDNRSLRLNSGVALDLTSETKNIVLGGNLFKDGQSVEITAGGEARILRAGSQVTAAEYIAVKQVLGGSGQQLAVAQNGTANGGSVDFGQITANNDHLRASNLTVASGVTTYGDFSKRSDFTLLGDLNNYGSVVALSNSRTGGVIRAEDITNQAGASISSNLPSQLASDATLSKSVDFELNARGVLANAGNIASSGSVTLSAGSEIKNSGVVKANDSINLYSPKISNSGRIDSLGNVNINGPSDALLVVDNNNGVIAAQNGAINVRTPDYTGTFDNKVVGGDLMSKELNLNAGSGTNYVNVDQLVGVVNQTGLASHVISSTDVLTIGDTCLTGDPTFFNTAGDINITGNVSVAEALTIVAKGNISSAAGTTIEARNASTGFDITMIAGANITSSGTNSSTLPGGTAGAVTIDGTASTTGGLVGLQSNVITSPTGSNGPGGNVSLFAFAGSATVSGIVKLDQATITTSGSGTGANGNLLIVAGGDNGPVGFGSAIQLANINTSGGTGGGGNFTAITAQPQSSGGPISYNADGTRSTAAQLVPGATLTTNADIAMMGANKVVRVGGDATLRAGDDIGQVNGAVMFIDNFNADVVLEAKQNIGNGITDPFTINGFNTLFDAKLLETLQPGNGTLSATAHNGGVTILRNATTTLNLLASSSQLQFFLRTGGALNINGNVSSAASTINLENTGGNLTIASGVQIVADLFVDIINASTKKIEPTFTIGQNVLIQTNTTTPDFGLITLALDPKYLLTEVGPVNFNQFKRVASQEAKADNRATLTQAASAPGFQNHDIGLSGSKKGSKGSKLKRLKYEKWRNSSYSFNEPHGDKTANAYGKAPKSAGGVTLFECNQDSIDVFNYSKAGFTFSSGGVIRAGNP
ncbi:MAG: hypothetical protein K2X93_18560 [Candidatus Obscuribacterales bacterium]|nr:hypothetical protein [Candidatus Obscuribacterales bacterium]